MRLRSPTDIDRQIGARIRLYRNVRGYTQERLAKAVGITFQQLQKYELAKNRISASRLWEVCSVLRIPIALMFQGVGL
ncbi:helix-turn-helix domain-containing protein [uncultured Bradyrhizobium sp.]|uniref:helix-turn-helix domain-containing protein n=1 Tax=uncultured Bradyrhizobium sp. TaxID=199684 RepID=UPI0035CC9CB8